MSPRLPLDTLPDPTVLDRLDKEAKLLHGDPLPYTWKDETRLYGPFAALAYQPDLPTPFFNLIRQSSAESQLPALHRELTLLALSSVHDAPYIRYSHHATFLAVGLTESQIAQGARGQSPEGLGGKEKGVYEFARGVAGVMGPVGDEVWERAGRDGLSVRERVVVVNLVGVYRWVATLVGVNDDQGLWRDGLGGESQEKKEEEKEVS